MEPKIIRCIICASEFTDAESEGVISCPSCQTTSIPCLISDDVEIKINWHELRVLTIWAENWAKQIDKKKPEDTIPVEKSLYAIMVIAERLQKQFPDKTPLTLFSEIRELRKDYNIETDIDNDKLLGL